MATATQATEHYVSRPDGRVFYTKVGRGEPLLFLHNIELSSFIWRKCIDKFATHFTCYLIDMPGHDRSDIPTQKYSIGDYGRAILDVMDTVGIKQGSIVGSHGGCVVAVEVAAQRPDRVRKLVLDGIPYWNLRVGRLVFERFWVPRFTDTTSYDVAVYPLKTWEEEVKKSPNLDREHWEKEEEISRRSRRWIRLSFEALTEYDVEAAGPRIKAPTLLVNGEQDVLRRGEQKAKDAIRSSQLKVVPGCRAPHWDKPDEFAKLALDFLR
ncbi:MAG: alpha/beta hydrolase [Chloroflexi bacterium]|nr:alpha/beta hydrolase [Chloroflexota bacterium]